MYSNFNEEKKLWKQGYQFVVGLDEAGRGPLAGPVVAAAVLFNKKFKVSGSRTSANFKFRDSKKLTEKQREFFYEKLTNHKNIKWGVGIVSEKVIDKINILEATKLAMQKALRQAQGKLKRKPHFLLIDGNFGIQVKIPQKSIVKGDEKVFSITAAGIIAKVTRDRIMQKMHIKYPQYGFGQHKGYGTSLHVKNLKSFGVSVIHRKSFEPVKTLVKTEII